MAQPNRALKARLKFRTTLPIQLEIDLTQKHGFEFFARNTEGGWTMFVKYNSSKSEDNIDFSDLPSETINELTRHVNRIAGCFSEPEKHKDVIKMRCTNLARTLGPRERAWVHAWIRRVIDEEDSFQDDLPWVMDSDELQQAVQEMLS